MERLLNPEERIRRAEEIYARRQNLRNKTKRATVNVNSERKNLKLFKKLVLQIVICVLMYFIFYLINTTNYSFPEITLNKTNEIISYDINFINIYNIIKDKINIYLENKKESNGNNQNDVIVNENENNIKNDEANEEKQEADTNTLGLEAKVEEETTEQEGTTKVEENLTDKIKKEYSFILPVKRNCHF